MDQEEVNEVLSGYDKAMAECYSKVEEKDSYYLSILKKILTPYKYKKLIEFMYEDGIVYISGFVRKHKVFGEKQYESYWFRHSYITQSSGYFGDDFSGTIFIPINEKHYLKFEFEC